MITPLIYSNRKQISAGEPVQLFSTISGDGSYQWSFTTLATSTPSALSSRNISVQFQESVQLQETNQYVTATWSSTTAADPTAIAYDSYEITIAPPTTLGTGQSPQTVYETIQLPNSMDTICIGINETGVYESINIAIEQLYDCFDYLIKKLQYVELPMTTMSFRYGSSKSSETSGMGTQWQQVSNEYDPITKYWAYTTAVSTNLITANTTNTLFVSGGNTLCIMSTTSGATPTIHTRTYPIFSTEPFSNIVSAILEEDGTIWVLENNATGRITQLQYFNGVWKFLNVWKNLVVTPTKLTIADDKIYVVAQRSNTDIAKQIHIFNKKMISTGHPIYNPENTTINSICGTRDYILTVNGSNRVCVYSKDGTYLTNIGLSQVFNFDPTISTLRSGTIQHIESCYDNYFFYAHTENLIYKFTQEGAVVGFGGVEAAVAAYNDDAVNDYVITGVYQDADRNLYTSSNHDIIKYVDFADYGTIDIKTGTFDIADCIWSLDDIKIKKNENCSYLVYNRVFNRFYDNIEIYRNCIGGKLRAKLGGLTVDGFRMGELSSLPYTKDEIYVGINELHCDGAINRNFIKLYECLNCLASLMSMKFFDADTSYSGGGQTNVYWNGVFKFDGSILFSGKI